MQADRPPVRRGFVKLRLCLGLTLASVGFLLGTLGFAGPGGLNKTGASVARSQRMPVEHAVRLSGAVPVRRGQAARLPRDPKDGDANLTLTLVLNRADQFGFE